MNKNMLLKVTYYRQGCTPPIRYKFVESDWFNVLNAINYSGGDYINNNDILSIEVEPLEQTQ